MKQVCDYTRCTGCSACVNKCPLHCISYKKDSIGHLIPNIDQNKCSDCGACISVCQVNKPLNLQTPLTTIGAYAIDEATHLASSSGGVAAVLSEYIISMGGVVYGCVFEKPFQVEHKRIVYREDLWKLRGSKYVESQLGDCFRKVKHDLSNELKVLFIGTPCQVAGLKRYLINDYSTLYTVDLVCHGVPPMHLLKESLPKEVHAMCFDTMEFRMCSKFHFSLRNGIDVVYARPIWRDLYLKAFFTALLFRNSCYLCPYATEKRVGDLTFGDFWGIQDADMQQKLKKGVSLVLVNQEKGRYLLTQISTSLHLRERILQEAVVANDQLSSPIRRTWRTNLFHKLYPHYGFKVSVCVSLWEVILKNKLLHLFR